MPQYRGLRGAQVPRTTGRSENPLSSWKQIHAPRRRPPQPLSQDQPGLRQRVPHAAHPLDHLRNPGQGPHVGAEPVGFWPVQQHRFHLGQLLVRQPRGPAQPIHADQGIPTTTLPRPMPPRRGLRRHPQLGRHVHPPPPDLEQLHRPHPTLPQGIHVTTGTTTRACRPCNSRHDHDCLTRQRHQPAATHRKINRSLTPARRLCWLLLRERNRRMRTALHLVGCPRLRVNVVYVELIANLATCPGQSSDAYRRERPDERQSVRHAAVQVRLQPPLAEPRATGIAFSLSSTVSCG